MTLIIFSCVFWSFICLWRNIYLDLLPFSFLFFFKGLQVWHMEVPKLRVQSELQLLAYTTATATQDPSPVCDLHHSSGQRQIPDPLSRARNRTYFLRDTNRIHFQCTTMGIPQMPDLWLNPLQGGGYGDRKEHQRKYWGGNLKILDVLWPEGQREKEHQR